MSGTTSTPVGDLQCFGLCIPWRDAHCRTGRRDREPWYDHLAYLRGLRGILRNRSKRSLALGDFNQTIPRTRAPAEVHAALMAAIGPHCALATGGEVAPIGRKAIDHIAHTRDLRCNVVASLSNVGRDEKLLSDHFVIVTSFQPVAETAQ